MKRVLSAFVVVFGLVAAGVAWPQSLPQVAPEQAGFSAERLARIKQTLRDDIEAAALPGAVLLIAREGKIAYFESLGALDPQTKAPMAKDSIFRIYSMTKPIVSIAALMLVEEGRISLSDPVAKYLP